jgi:dephospho-CoA kinase
MLRIGLTGGTACGKSTVLAMFRRKPGIHVIDADAIVHELYQRGSEVHRLVAERYGNEVLNEDGDIDRAILGEIVFSNPSELRMLEEIVHPAVEEVQMKQMDALENQQPDCIALVEATKMLEAGTYKKYDHVILVVCSPEEQLKRYQSRNPKLSLMEAKQDLEQRVRAQYSDLKRRSLVPTEWVIDNSNTRAETEEQVERIYRKLCTELAERP